MKYLRYDELDIVIFVHPKVYSPSEDTFLILERLLDEMKDRHIERALEIGCGTGILSIVLAKFSKEVVAVDKDPYAVRCTMLNAYLNGVRTKMRIMLGDLFEPLDPEEEFDVIVFNAPYLPPSPPSSDVSVEGGLGVIGEFLKGARSHLGDDGEILMTCSSETPMSEVVRILKGEGYHYLVLKSVKVFMEEIFLVKAMWRK